MKVRIFGIIVSLLGLLGVEAVSAQELPLLPQDPAVRSAVFPNGLSCYAAENKSCKGYADFTLIRREYSGNDLVHACRNVLLSSESAVDSVLLGLMRRVEKDAMASDCAVIVCGDIDPQSIIMKLKYMSLMVDASRPSPLPEYVWDGDAQVRTHVLEDTLRGLASVRFEWSAPRIPRQSMNTIQSAVYEKYAWELGEIATAWVKRSLHKKGIPYADVSFGHECMNDGFGDDAFSFEVTVAQEDAEKARLATMSVLSSLDMGKTSVNDVLLSDYGYLLFLEKSAMRPVVVNQEYTRMCRDAFLHNKALSSDKERLAFFRSKAVPELTRREIFNKMASALLEVSGPHDTVSLSCRAMLSDTLGLPSASEQKMRVRSYRRDSFSGGTVWTFANGFKVIYRKVPSADRRLYYSLTLGGGFGNISDLEAGEGAYMSEYLDQCWIAGMKGRDFKDMLSLCGMTMDTKVNLFHTTISGHVEDNDASLLMKSLLAVANDCRPDTLEIDYYARCEALRRSMAFGKDPRVAVDSLLCPGYKYTQYKTGAGFDRRVFAKAEALFASMTSKMNDGMLVLVGDMNEAELKRVLQSYVEGFRVKNIASRRPSVNYRPAAGWCSHEAEGEDTAVWVVTAPLEMSAVNHFAAEMAARFLERRIDAAFSPKGIHTELSVSRSIYPEERFSVMVKLTGECGREEMAQLRKMLEECASGVTDAELRFCKEFLKNSYRLQIQTPEYWLRVIPLRHMEGKDFTTGFDAKIDAVTPQVLEHVFRAMHNGAGMEYISTKKK